MSTQQTMTAAQFKSLGSGLARPRRARHVPGKMNKTERDYADHLEILKRAGEIVRYRFEPIKLRLADRTFYESDFLVTTPEHMELHEVKGHWEDDARVKIKVAAEIYPEFAFVAVTKAKGGGWETEVFKP